MNTRRYALRHARKTMPRTVEPRRDGSVRVVKADGTVMIGRPTKRAHTEVHDEPGS